MTAKPGEAFVDGKEQVWVRVRTGDTGVLSWLVINVDEYTYTTGSAAEAANLRRLVPEGAPVLDSDNPEHLRAVATLLREYAARTRRCVLGEECERTSARELEHRAADLRQQAERSAESSSLADDVLTGVADAADNQGGVFTAELADGRSVTVVSHVSRAEKKEGAVES